jgi:hypothetical protein
MSPAKEVLPILTKLGPTAAETVPGILPLLSHSDSRTVAAAANAFASVAPQRAELVPAILPHLTNEAVAAPLLLWLTSIGTNAATASGEVYGLARETTHYPEASGPRALMLDPVLARRYGLIPPGAVVRRPTTGTNGKQTNWLKPSAIKLNALEHCPQALVRFWPGFEQTYALVTNQVPDASAQAQTQLILAKLPRSHLAELAQRCLASIAAGNPAWQLPSDARSQ